MKILKTLNKLWYLLSVIKVNRNGDIKLDLHGNQILVSVDGISLYSEGVIRLNGLYTFIQCDSKFSTKEAEEEIKRCEDQKTDTNTESI